MKRVTLFLTTICLLAPLLFGITRHTIEDAYIFETITVSHPQDVNVPVQLHDEWGNYPMNEFTVDVNLPSGLSMTSIVYVNCPDTNDLCAKFRVIGNLPIGEYQILFHVQDVWGNDEWASLKLNVADITPPSIGCGGLF